MRFHKCSYYLSMQQNSPKFDMLIYSFYINMKIAMKIAENPVEVCKDYFLKSPIGNHHVVFTGDHTKLLDAFCETILENK